MWSSHFCHLYSCTGHWNSIPCAVSGFELRWHFCALCCWSAAARELCRGAYVWAYALGGCSSNSADMLHVAVQCLGVVVMTWAVFLKLGSERRKCVMAQQFYWRSEICTYECKWKISFNYGVFKCSSWKILFDKHDVFHFDFFSLIIILIFWNVKMHRKVTVDFKGTLFHFLHVTYIKER